jgi:hypothetical protein
MGSGSTHLAAGIADRVDAPRPECGDAVSDHPQRTGRVVAAIGARRDPSGRRCSVVPPWRSAPELVGQITGISDAIDVDLAFELAVERCSVVEASHAGGSAVPDLGSAATTV